MKIKRSCFKIKMFDVILAMTKSGGIGIENRLPWKIPEELALFKSITKNSILICGKKTVEYLPPLKDRKILCVTRNPQNIETKNSIEQYSSVESALASTRGRGEGGVLSTLHDMPSPIFVIGGKQIYDYVFKHMADKIRKVYVSIINVEYPCSHYIEEKFEKYHITESFSYSEFTHYVLQKNVSTSADEIYFKILRNVYENGMLKNNRNGITKSVFFQNMSFNLMDGFPLLTTKRMFIKGIVEELLFFLKGETNSLLLEEKGITIWKGNTERKFLDENGWNDRKEGEMGPMYGWQWRRFGQDLEDKSITEENDMLYNVVKNIRSVINGNASSARRLLLTTFNPKQAEEGVLYPCHSIIIQFNVEKQQDKFFLDMITFNRSQDFFHGVPFNMAMASLLLTIIANICGATPRYLHMSMGDCHIYEEHFSVVKEQLSRFSFEQPQCRMKKNIFFNSEDTAFSHSIFSEIIFSLTKDDFEFINYRCHSTIKTNMIA